MTETTSGPGEAAPVTTRDYVRAVVWIGVILAIVVVAMVVFFNLLACGCGTRPAG